MDLEQDLAHLPEDVVRILDNYAFDRRWFLGLAQRVHEAGSARRETNYIRGKLSQPTSQDIAGLPPVGSAEAERLDRLGRDVIAKGEVALAVLAGGMATRMGGVVKALVPIADGRSFLDYRLAEVEHLGGRGERRMPFWLMASYATQDALLSALRQRSGGSPYDGYHLAVFPQFVSLRLTPEGRLFRDAEGRPSLHAPGHGDLPDALRASGLLERFIERGGRYVTVANIDNLGAGVDPLIVGYQIEHGHAALCEVVDKRGSDRGGIPVRVDGRPEVLEEFRIPPSFDPSQVKVFNTNTFHFDARALQDARFEFQYFMVEKQVDGQPVIQFERLLGEMTSHLDTSFLHVPRDGAGSRFLPVKDFDELEARAGEIATAARARGMLEDSDPQSQDLSLQR